ncbi:PTS lactose/cellobiose transporter subunit IIA [Companilactobacillus sp. HBUAS59699]|uniref:PTS lactose/cellobiose transporter subunit IIA n=1 Tax=Companilactobacillus sp. HBUAS59699 TaxID=3109358 RepID=UPI002FF2D1BC
MSEDQNDAQLEVCMGLIINGGSAKSFAFEAIKAAKNNQFDTAIEKLKEADKYLIEAHNVQTQMLKNEADGKSADISLMMVHAQDHLMTAITFRDLAGEIVDLYKKLDSKK